MIPIPIRWAASNAISVSSLGFVLTRKNRARGLLRFTLLGLFLGSFASISLVSELTVATNPPASVPNGLQFVGTDGYQTRFQQWGPPSTRTIVLLHGAFESSDSWAPVAKLLATSNHVEAVDLKGYGYTTHVGPYTTEALARQLFAFLSARKISQPILVGHSVGAGVIARFVLDHPHVAGEIVFLDGDGLQLTYPGKLFINWIPSLYLSALYQSGIHSGFLIRSIFGAACGPRCRPLSDKTLAEIQRPLEVAGVQDALFAYAHRPIVGVTLPQLKRLRSYRIPSAVSFGSRDSEFSLRSAYQTAMRIGAPSPTIIHGAGHLSMWSNPVQVANAIERFVTGLARP